jgi:hypothetical protein
LAFIFSDVNGLVPITQPIITDGFGHYDFYAAQGLYTLVVGLGGVISQVYPDQNIGAQGGGSAGQTLIAGANITIIGNVISAVIPPGGVTLQTNGVNNTLQSKLNLQDTASVTWSSDAFGGVTATAAGGSSFSASGSGILWGSSGLGTSLSGGAAFGAVDDQILFALMILTNSWTIRRIVTKVQTGTGNAGDRFNVGIYSADGSTKIVDIGPTSCASGATTHELAITPVVIPAGTYLFVSTRSGGLGGDPQSGFGYDISVAGLATVLSGFDGPGGGIHSISYPPLYVGLATNTATSSVLPASLGALLPNPSIPSSVPSAMFLP